MTGWTDLRQELKAWQASGQTATLWWRDDDAIEPTRPLEMLQSLALDHDVPLTLAVIPERNRLTTGDLDSRVTPAQHGYAHRNHAGTGAKKCELGPERRVDHVIGELMTGRDVLERSFGDRFRAILVPPWNRLSPQLQIMLPELGYVGLSQFGARDFPAIGSMKLIHTHVDIIDWKGTRGFVGEDAALGQLIDHLKQRRTGGVDREEATGLLTHHLAHDPACWPFLARLFEETRSNRSVTWCNTGTLFYD